MRNIFEISILVLMASVYSLVDAVEQPKGTQIFNKPYVPPNCKTSDCFNPYNEKAMKLIEAKRTQETIPLCDKLGWQHQPSIPMPEIMEMCVSIGNVRARGELAEYYYANENYKWSYYWAHSGMDFKDPQARKYTTTNVDLPHPDSHKIWKITCLLFSKGLGVDKSFSRAKNACGISSYGDSVNPKVIFDSEAKELLNAAIEEQQRLYKLSDEIQRIDENMEFMRDWEKARNNYR